MLAAPASSGVESDEVPSTASADHEALTCKPLLPLDVGFASVELKELEQWPWHELRVVAQCDECQDDAGVDAVDALLEYLEYILNLSQVCTGFMLTYHLQELRRLHMDVIMQIMCWSSEPCRQAKWLQRCLGWKIVITDQWSFQLARLFLASTFYLSPPSSATYLMNDASAELSGDGVVRYLPDDEELPCREPPAPDLPLVQGDVLQPSIQVNCAEVSQGPGYLMISGRDADVTDESLTEMMAFMDKFVGSPNAAKGFSITYDLRALHAPSMSMVKRVADWGAEPVRQERWQRLNIACKIVVSSGIKFTVAKGVLTTFFYMCPPVCRTYLMWEIDQPEDTCTIFESSTQKLHVEPVEAPLALPPPAGCSAEAGPRVVDANTADGVAPPQHELSWLLTCTDF